MTQCKKAEILRGLHQRGSSLLLPNAWDAASARLFEEAGFTAIATTSAGVAYTRGYSDGQRIGRDEMLREIARIASVVTVPVTADIEAGYGPDVNDVAKTIQGVLAAGAVGVNLEDSTGDPANPLYSIDAQTERMAAARAEAQNAGVPLVINARIDTYLANVCEPPTRLEETVRRPKAYLQAGADCVFAPLVIDPPTIQALVREIPGPLNMGLSRDPCDFLSYGHQSLAVSSFQLFIQNRINPVEQLSDVAITQRENQGFRLQTG